METDHSAAERVKQLEADVLVYRDALQMCFFGDGTTYYGLSYNDTMDTVLSVATNVSVVKPYISTERVQSLEIQKQRFIIGLYDK